MLNINFHSYNIKDKMFTQGINWQLHSLQWLVNKQFYLITILENDIVKIKKDIMIRQNRIYKDLMEKKR
jgi:hypothetical protein